MNPTEASRIITSVLHGYAGNNDEVDAGTAALSRLVNSGRVPDLLRSIRDSAHVVSRYAPESYRHPLGFDKITLLDASPAFMLRLHTWWPEDHHGTEHVHNHRFDLASAVLRGSYEMQVFQEAENGVLMTEYREHSAPSDTEWIMNVCGSSYLRSLVSARIAQGSGYALAADVLHRVIVPHEALCVTLFLALPGETGIGQETRIFAASNDVARHPGTKHAFTTQEYRRHLDKVSTLLTG